MSSAIQEDYELEKVTFPRKEKRGIVLGLDLMPLIAVGLIVLCIVIATIAVPFPYGALLGVALLPVAGVLGWGRFRHRHLFEWAALGLGHVRRMVGGQNQYRAPSPRADAAAESKALEKAEKADEKAAAEAEEWDEPIPAKTPKPIHMRLPGEANELKVYDTPSGMGIVHDPRRRRIILTARMKSKNFTLQDDSVQAEILDRWANLMDVMGAHPEVRGLYPSDVTTVVTSSQMQSFYERAARENNAGAALNPVAHAGYLELLSQNVMTHHPQYLTVDLAIPALREEIKASGSGMTGLLAVADRHAGALETDLKDNGWEVDYWVTTEQRMEMLHTTFSPDDMQEDVQAHGKGGPVGARRYWDKMRCDNAWHRSFVIDEWPLKPVRPGFLEKLILDLEFRHTLTLLIKRGNDEQALRRISNDIKDAETAEGITERAGRRVSREMLRERADMEAREEELVAGASDISFRGFVTVTADTPDELDQFTRQLKSAAARASVRLEVCYGQQFEGFLAGAGQLGFGDSR